MPNLIGTNANQVSTNGMLGTAAFVDVDQLPAPTIASALVLLATLSPTAAANIDFLNVFTSTYDDYLIIGNGIKFATDDVLALRFANAGTVDTASNYRSLVGTGTEQVSSANYYDVSAATSLSGNGSSFKLAVSNTNQASQSKFIFNDVAIHTPAGHYLAHRRAGAYSSSAISGFRLYGVFGYSFSAQGSIKVYGIAKS